MSWCVKQVQVEARWSFGRLVPAAWLDRCAEEAVLEVVGAGVRVADYVAELALRRVREAVERWERAGVPATADGAAS